MPAMTWSQRSPALNHSLNTMSIAVLSEGTAERHHTPSPQSEKRAEFRLNRCRNKNGRVANLAQRGGNGDDMDRRLGGDALGTRRADRMQRRCAPPKIYR